MKEGNLLSWGSGESLGAMRAKQLEQCSTQYYGDDFYVCDEFFESISVSCVGCVGEQEARRWQPRVVRVLF